MTTVEVTAAPHPRAVISPPEAPTVTAVIVTYGTGPVVIEAIAALAAHSTGIEVVVVDNQHPTVGDRVWTELLLATRGVRVVRPRANLGFGGGCELGALHARGAFLAFVNPDLIVGTGWLEPLVRLAAGTPPALAAPMLVDRDGSVQECGQRLYADGTTRAITTAPPDGATRAVDYASAACWVIARDVHERIGGFDPDYFPAYFEDVDYALRARRLGVPTIVDASVTVVHDKGHGTPDAPSPAHEQRELLVARQPDLTWTQPSVPSRRR